MNEPVFPANRLPVARLRTWRILGWIQGSYFLLTGLWPWLSPHTFELITGPKVDMWLAQIVGALISLIAVLLLKAARRGILSSDTASLALTSAAALAVMDGYALLQTSTTAAYLGDLFVELALVVAWIVNPPPKRR